MNELLLILLPGSMYLWVLFIGQGPMQEILHEKESHILPRLLAGPVTLSQFLLAKLARSCLLCGGSLVALTVATSLLFRVSWGNPAVLALVIAGCALSMTGQLAFVYSLARTREQANVFSTVIVLVLAMIGGSMFPFENLPGFIQAAGNWTPNRWAVLALRGVAAGKPLTELALPVAGLIGFGGAGTVVAMIIFRRQLDGRCR